MDVACARSTAAPILSPVALGPAAGGQRRLDQVTGAEQPGHPPGAELAGCPVHSRSTGPGSQQQG